MIHYKDANQSLFGVLFGDNSNKFLEVDTSITVSVSIVNHLINFLGAEAFTYTFTNFLEIFWAKATGSLRVKGFIKLLECALIATIIVAEDIKESFEIKLIFSGSILNNVEDILGLTVHVQCSNSIDYFFDGDLATVIIVEDIENFLHLDDCVNSHIFGNIFFWLESLN